MSARDDVAIEVRPLSGTAQERAALGALLVETVALGGSVSFMYPLDDDVATGFWDGCFASAGRGERIILGATYRDDLIGTVTLLLDMPQNQPHRAEIAKMMTAAGYRGRGVASALMREAERLALERNRTLLVLDTASDGGASGLYERLGFTLVGEIPDFALKPRGGLTGTKFYYKRVGG